MDSSRRIFLKSSAVLAASAALLPNYLFAESKKIERLGLQLYTVRDAMRADPAGTLEKLSDMGYLHVEHAGYHDRKFYGYAPKDFKKLLEDTKLTLMGGHVVLSQKYWNAGSNDFTDEWKYIIDDAATVEQKYVISPMLDSDLLINEDVFKRFMNVFNKCGELCHRHGLQFGYHNGGIEFTTLFGTMPLYDVMLDNTDPGLVSQELDIGNMYAVGVDPITYIKKYPGRFELIHVRDEAKNTEGKYESVILGKGVMPVKEILKVARKIGGSSQFIIEQEVFQGMDPMLCAKLDLKVMTGWDY